MDVGRSAVFADPMGAAFSIWQPRAHKGAGLVDEPGTYSWSELVTTDVPAASRFYETVFGWGTEGHGEGQGDSTSGRSMVAASAG